MTTRLPVEELFQRLAEHVAHGEFWVQREVWAPGSIVRLSAAPWLQSLEAALPVPIPRIFRDFLNFWEFLRFEAGGIDFFPNTPHGPDSFIESVFADPIISKTTLRNRFLQFGRPDTGSYDPVCFSLPASGVPYDAPIVRLDHEELLIRERIVVTEHPYPSFQAFLLAVQAA